MQPWCSTLVDETGHHVGGQGKWGNCGPGCPIPPDDRPPQEKGKGDNNTASSLIHLDMIPQKFALTQTITVDETLDLDG